MENWRETLRQTLALHPEHVSLYGLVLEDNTPMLAWVEGGRVPEPDDDLAADMYDVAGEAMAASGFQQYEISNWSQPGYECRHNLQYWHNHPYVGMGPGAHGYAGAVRYATLLSPQRYIRAMRQADSSYVYPLTPAVQDVDPVTRESEITDTLLMGLRLTNHGIRRDAFLARFGEDVLDARGAVLLPHEAAGLLEITPEHVRLTSQGRLLSNLIFRDLV
jgi:oxygen-independent coproporphyrinogen-3 oxidase